MEIVKIGLAEALFGAFIACCLILIVFVMGEALGSSYGQKMTCGEILQP